MGLSRQEMFKKGFYAGVESAPGIDNYPPVEIETLHHTTISDDATVDTLEKSAVYQAMEARDASNKKQKVREKKITTQEQPCKNFRQAGQTYVHQDIKEEMCSININKKGGRPPWFTKKPKKLNN